MSRADGNLRVIGAGFGRTGTTSLMKALEILGVGPCYHMRTAMLRPGHAKFWIRAKAGDFVDFKRFFRSYRSTVDWPACEFYRELMDVYPDARILLNVRDPEVWYDSMFETLWAVKDALPWWFPSSIARMHDEVLWKARFNGEFADRAKSISVYKSHVEQVRRTVPTERLLEYSVSEGWGPLCEFLAVPVPQGVPFPQANDRKFFRRVLLVFRIAEWAVPAAAIVAAAWLLTAIA